MIRLRVVDLLNRRELLELGLKIGSLSLLIKGINTTNPKIVSAQSSSITQPAQSVSGLEFLINEEPIAPNNGMVFPEKGKVGWYRTNTGFEALMYNDLDDQYVQVVAWQNNNSCDREPLFGYCIGYRGWGEFLADGSLMVHLYSQGDTVTPVESTHAGSFQILKSGQIATNLGAGILIDNRRYADGRPFFGIGSSDGVYFSQQWLPVAEKIGEPKIMRLLDQNTGPFYVDFDFQAISITLEDLNTYFVQPAIGAGRTGLEFGWVRKDSDGIRRQIENPHIPSHLFHYTPGWEVVDIITPTGDWWLKPKGQESELSWLNGRALKVKSRNPDAEKEYKKLGPVRYNVNLFPDL